MTSTTYNSCLLCLQTSENLLHLSSERGKELNVASILSTHFWFQLDEMKSLSQNICSECWKNTQSFHEFYQTIRLAHGRLETTFVKNEYELSIEDYGETYKPAESSQDTFVINFVEPENCQADEDDESSNASVYEAPQTNSVDTEMTVIPAKSKNAYESTYNTFEEWLKKKNMKTINEKVVLAYFHFKSRQLKPSTLWCEYSKLRTMICLNRRIDISTFSHLVAFLKGQSKGYSPMKSKIFVREEIDRFFEEADDKQFLLMKTALIIGVAGACRRCELTNLSITDVIDWGDIMVVDMKETKKNVHRQFVINEGVVQNINLLDIIRKYLSLRSKTTTTDRFFVGYRAGKCTSQPMGINTIGEIPKKIAKFLGLQDAELYTGHCFRRTSATLLVDADAALIAFKQHGGWNSLNLAESSMVSSPQNKRRNGMTSTPIAPPPPLTIISKTVAPNPCASTNMDVAAIPTIVVKPDTLATDTEEKFVASQNITIVSTQNPQSQPNDFINFMNT